MVNAWLRHVLRIPPNVENWLEWRVEHNPLNNWIRTKCHIDFYTTTSEFVWLWVEYKFTQFVSSRKFVRRLLDREARTTRWWVQEMMTASFNEQFGERVEVKSAEISRWIGLYFQYLSQWLPSEQTSPSNPPDSRE